MGFGRYLHVNDHPVRAPAAARGPPGTVPTAEIRRPITVMWFGRYLHVNDYPAPCGAGQQRSALLGLGLHVGGDDRLGDRGVVRGWG